jgi:hypothetical protein
VRARDSISSGMGASRTRSNNWISNPGGGGIVFPIVLIPTYAVPRAFLAIPIR